MLTKLSDNSQKLNTTQAKNNWADVLRKIGFVLTVVLTKKSKLNLNDKDVFPQVCIDVF